MPNFNQLEPPSRPLGSGGETMDIFMEPLLYLTQHQKSDIMHIFEMLFDRITCYLYLLYV